VDHSGEWILWPIEIRKFKGKTNTKFGQSFQIVLFNKQYTLLYPLLSYLGQTKCWVVTSKRLIPVELQVQRSKSALLIFLLLATYNKELLMAYASFPQNKTTKIHVSILTFLFCKKAKKKNASQHFLFFHFCSYSKIGAVKY